MAWENKIVGYEIKHFKKDEPIPADAKFLTTSEVFVRMYGMASNPKARYETIYHYQVPVYKKVNVKRKQTA